MDFKLLSCVALVAIAAGSAAHAGVTISSVTPNDTINPGEMLVADFSGTGAPGDGFTYSGTTFNTGTTSVAAAPWLDMSQYAYVLGGQSATLASPYALQSLSVYIGSIDAYNTIEFFGTSGVVGTITGDQILPGASGNQGNGGSARVDFGFSAPVTSIKFESSQNSLEFDDIAVKASPVSAAPEPSTWALMLGGIGLLGGMLRLGHARRREDQATEMAEAG